MGARKPKPCNTPSGCSFCIFHYSVKHDGVWYDVYTCNQIPDPPDDINAKTEGIVIMAPGRNSLTWRLTDGCPPLDHPLEFTAWIELKERGVI
jgi:hypothetical protein